MLYFVVDYDILSYFIGTEIVRFVSIGFVPEPDFVPEPEPAVGVDWPNIADCSCRLIVS